MNASTAAPLMVVGAGIAGVTAALEAAEAGREVILVEREPSIGGRVLRSHNYFPKLCPPSCGMELNTRRAGAEPARPGVHQHHGDQGRARRRRLVGDPQDRTGLRQRPLHRLRRLRQGVPGQGARPLQPGHDRGAGDPPAAPGRLAPALRAGPDRLSRRLHRLRRRLQVRRHRSERPARPKRP